MARTYSASRLVFNRSIRNDVNMRVFEALACGSLLMTNDLADNGQDELFQDGVHLATYRDGDELLDKIHFYLRREDLRERLAAAGRSEALSRHTYRHRMQWILESVAVRLSTEMFLTPSAASTVPPEDQDPGKTFRESGLVDLVPLAVGDVLALGPDVEHLAEALEARQGARVVIGEGFQPFAGTGHSVPRSEEAGSCPCPEFAPASFDAIVCDGFLELLDDPRGLLRQARGWLKPDGHLIAGLPNVRHHSMVSALMGGHWPTGLMGPATRDLRGPSRAARSRSCSTVAVSTSSNCGPSRGRAMRSGGTGADLERSSAVVSGSSCLCQKKPKSSTPPGTWSGPYQPGTMNPA